ncbi:MAG: histidine kinase [Oscillospiraceae bacterium]|nr:histidine kinase [Oscillospiraceae bacterium]
MPQELLERIGLPKFMHVTVDCWNELIILLLLFVMVFGIQQDKEDEQRRQVKIPMTGDLIIYFLAVLLYNLCDIVIITSLGKPGSASHILLIAFMFCYYLIGWGQVVFFLQVIKDEIAEALGKIRLKRFITIVQFCQIPLLILLLITPFTDIMYNINSQNLYTRSPGYYIWQITTIITFIIILVIVIAQWRNISTFHKNIFITAAIFPVMGLIGGLYMDANLNSLMVIISILLLFLLYEQNKTEVIIRTERELEESKRRLTESRLQLEQSKNQTLMAQIQPHFINNSLMALCARCAKYPEIYEDLTNFSKYLRSHFDALGDTKTIPFEQEMLNIEAYLTLEQQNYKERLQVEYEIECDDFMIPALSVQPLVENAVRHGIGTYDKGGTVQINSYRKDGKIIIEVIDDGSGKSNITPQQSKRKGIGVENVRARLASMSNGVLDIITSDQGTTARITISEEGNQA